MPQTFFFYDLETSGLNPRQDRIMQFAGQRTTLDFKPIGEPYNILVKLNDDTLPSPDALMVTGITPQQTQADGYTEAEFARILIEEVFTEDTITVGFNNIRFDDEFIRALFWRTFNDPYEWAWRDGRGRWDMLDVVRMTRALRPAGIEWPVVDGKETNRLELLTKLNGIDHFKAHDALSDVEALIAVTKLIQEKQPQLYAHLFKYKDKKQVASLVNLEDKTPFVYVSGRYDAAYHKATVAFPLTTGRNGAVVAYDLRYDPMPFISKSPKELAELLFATWEARQAEGFQKVPVKELQLNRAPAVAPLGVLEREDGWARIGLDEETIARHRAVLLANPSFAENIRTAFESRPEFAKEIDPEGQLYEGFVPDTDRLRSAKVRQASANELADLHPEFIDERLNALLLHYKARNYPTSLAEDEAVTWESWRAARIQAQLPGFVKRLQELATKHAGDDSKEFILQELQLWAESVVPLGE
ncbi:TPA: exodeoxyribonuclease I [Candidatus Saccharibacteria bacterium]|nr:exodeoxyribonuclease I [Candidatus Saccharibacteria bacterium]|tara:strand:- start:773 stop:2191 length:1419 start_codon:yes stop_codon:yes gene_type:complete